MSAASASTATATTGTADSRRAYRGRFAPSPSGSLHLGSLAAALGSWLDARHHGGSWLIRIEDLDTPRVLPGAAEEIIRVLAACGLESDESPPLRQSTRTDAYAAAFATLSGLGMTYPCSCTRRETASGTYPGTCRRGTRGPAPWSWRLRMPECGTVEFEDGFQGPQQRTWRSLGDPVIRRRDGIPAYQLAVVVDDSAQGITDVVRGVDLLDATPWQLEIRRLLQGPPARHAHLPLVREHDGRKLSKSESAAAISGLPAGAALVAALDALHQAPPPDLASESVPAILGWGLRNWTPAALAETTSS
ncbi:MAG: glutamyl-Q tRNA(Asp) synthetase [Pseudomonadota bacterium]